MILKKQFANESKHTMSAAPTMMLIDAMRILGEDAVYESSTLAAFMLLQTADRMEELCSELLFQKQLAEKYVKAGKICSKIYIARNISLSEKCVLSALAEIDVLYRTPNEN